MTLQRQDTAASPRLRISIAVARPPLLPVVLASGGRVHRPTQTRGSHSPLSSYLRRCFPYYLGFELQFFSSPTSANYPKTTRSIAPVHALQGLTILISNTPRLSECHRGLFRHHNRRASKRSKPSKALCGGKSMRTP